MKRILYFLIAVGSLLTFAVPSAQAHVLKTDGTIGAVFHVDPDDDPQIGQPASFFFDISDTTGAFQLAHCVCTASLVENGKVLDSTRISQAGLDQASFQYTLQKKDVYQVELTGVPTPGNSFQKFSITWDLRVDRTAQTDSLAVAWRSLQSHGPEVLLMGLAPILAMFLIMVQQIRDARKLA